MQWMGVVWTQSDFLFLPSAAAMLQTRALYQQDPKMFLHETQSRDGILGLNKTKVLTWTLLWTSNWRRRKQVRFVRSGYFHTRSNVRLRWSIKDTPTLSQEIVKLFFPLQRSIPPRTRPPAIPSRRRRKWWMCLLFFLHDVSFCCPLFLCWRSFTFLLPNDTHSAASLEWRFLHFA